jgi:hypothetical protein
MFVRPRATSGRLCGDIRRMKKEHVAVDMPAPFGMPVPSTCRHDDPRRIRVYIIYSYETAPLAPACPQEIS